MIEYLKRYIEDCEIDYLKEQFTEEIIEILENEKEKVINKLEEKLKEDKEVDIYMELSENIDKYI